MSEMEGFIESLREAFFALRGASTRMLEDLECSPAERGVLLELGKEGPRPVPAMARLRGVSRQAMQKAVDAMIERGWLRTEPNPDHARSQLIALTPAGEKLGAAIRRREQAMMEGAQLPVSASELARTAAVLIKLKPFFEGLEPR
jgi:DNA-binding MarR family transcriptional regulator